MKTEDAHEVCAQGSVRAALAIEADIGSGLKCNLESSTDEASYGSVRIQPSHIKMM